MNLRFLDTFIWVARLKSFSLAADKLCLTQASVSSRIAVLEAELGAKLFVRDTKAVTLTSAGERILGHAEQVVATVGSLRAVLQGDTQPVGRLRIGAMDTVVHTWFVDLIAELTHSYPNLEVEIAVDTALNLAEQLRKGFLDIIFQTDSLRDDSIASLELARYRMAWIGPMLSPGTVEPPLFSRRLITYSPNSRPHQDLLRLLREQNQTSARVTCVNSVAAILRLVRNDFGVGALPPLLVREQLANREMQIIEQPPLLPPMPIVASWRTNISPEWLDRTLQTTISVVRRYCEDAGPGFAMVMDIPLS